MKWIEADAKLFLSLHGIRIPNGFLLSFAEDAWPLNRPWNGPVYVKAQMLSGRRGKRGFVRRALDEAQFSLIIREMKQELHPELCAGFLVEEEIQKEKEYFISFDLDRAQGCVRCHYSFEGGQEVAQAKTMSVEGERDFAREDIPLFLQDLLKKLYQLFCQEDLLSLEINPLAVCADGSCVALDAKVESDDAALFRHEAWQACARLSPIGRAYSSREQAYQSFLAHAGHRGTFSHYVELSGDVALILSGGGASLVALDALIHAGGQPGNYSEMSGNPDPARVYEGVRIILSRPGVRALWIAGSYANFTNIRDTVAATLRAVEQAELHIPIVIRRDGPGAEEAEQEARAWAERTGNALVFYRGDTSFSTAAHTLMRLMRA